MAKTEAIGQESLPPKMILGFIQAFREVKRFKSLPESREIVFYAETKSDWVHFEPIIRELTEKDGKTIVYVTSDSSDSVLTTENPRIKPFFIGSGFACTWWFQTLAAKVCVITLTDLDTYHLKRSRVAPVHYVYVFHSLTSTHRAFRKRAHHAYDTILCSGPHHKAEIKRAEEVYHLKPKNLVEHGYGRLDSILDFKRFSVTEDRKPKMVLIAPSYGPGSISETCVEPLIESLLSAGHRVVYRPHFMTLRRVPRHQKKILGRFSSQPNFTMELDLRSTESLLGSDVMISDWSGAALEYAFGLEKPVLFVNTPSKINNPEHEKIGLEPIEEFIRPQIGMVLEVSEIKKTGEVVNEICSDPKGKVAQIQAARERWIYNVGCSGRVGAEVIGRILNSYDRLRQKPLESTR